MHETAQEQRSKMGAFNMKERKEPKFVQFAPGEVVEGVLVRIDTMEVGVERKPTARFVVRDLDSGEMLAFLGTYDIATKLQRSDVGHVVSVRYEGEDKSVQRNGNAMKRFKVSVSDQLYDPAVISDADIGF